MQDEAREPRKAKDAENCSILAKDCIGSHRRSSKTFKEWTTRQAKRAPKEPKRSPATAQERPRVSEAKVAPREPTRSKRGPRLACVENGQRPCCHYAAADAEERDGAGAVA